MFIESGKPDARLTLALNVEWLAAKLSQALWREGETPAKIGSIMVEQVRETKKGVTLLYEAAVNGAAQLYVGHLVPHERLAEEHASVLKKAKAEPLHGRAVVVVPEVDLILSAFPNDRKLKLISEDYLRHWLAENLHAVAPGLARAENFRIEETAFEVLRYVPERRFTARCRVRLRDENHSTREISFIAKQLTDAPKARRLFNNLRSLQNAWRHDEAVAASQNFGPHAPSRAAPPMRLPRAWAWEEKRAVVFIEDLPGENLKQLLPEIDLPLMLAQVGAALADFHRAQKRVRKRVTLKNELKENREALSVIARTFPHLRPRMKSFVAQLRASSEQLQTSRQVLLHGTYRLNHIFLHGDELVLLDLDSLRLGPPAYDLANFISSLYYLEAQERVTPALRRQMSRHFLEGYAGRSSRDVPAFEVLWFTASLLLNKQASKYVTHMHDDREVKTLRMLALAEHNLQRCRDISETTTLAMLGQILP